MLLYRGALVYAEDRNPDERSGHTPPEAEVLGHGHKLPQGVHDKITVMPIINHGRWLIPCPWCYSASAASRDDHRFYCIECRSAGAQGKWVKVIWPDSKDEIEALLIMRPDPRTRNWQPPETVAQLLAENESHAVI